MQACRHAFQTSLRPRSLLRPHSLLNGCRPSFRAFHDETALPRSIINLPALANGVDNGIVGIQTAIEQLHTFSGLPWYATLPLTAVLVRLFMLPFFTIPSRMAEQRRLAIAPLLQAHAENIKIRFPHLNRNRSPATIRRMVQATIKRRMRYLKRRWNCTALYTVGLPLMQLPIFIAIQEAMRRLTGSHSSLLGLAVKSVSPEQADTLDASQTMTGLTSTAADQVIEELKTGGCLWFTDLTAADPYAALSIATSAVMFFHIWRTLRRDAGQNIRTTGLTRLTRFNIIMAAAIGFITHLMPSGMMLYWFSSSVITTITGIAMDRVFPLRKPPLSLIARQQLAKRAAAEKRAVRAFANR